MSNRVLQRSGDAVLQFPLRCVFRIKGQEHSCEVINFHFLGACLRAPTQVLRAHLLERWPQELELRLGTKTLREHVTFRLSWETLADDGLFGIEFLKSVAPFVERSSRFPLHERHRATMTSVDPLDPNRTLFFNVHNVSKGGMLLTTSLANKHLFPGMLLKDVRLQVASQPELKLQLSIENTRSAPEEGIFFIGVSVQESSLNVVEVFRPHLSAFGTARDVEHSAELLSTKTLGRHLKGALSFRTLQTGAEYQELLQLRFSGYSKHGKIRKGSTWRDMGEGLANEGRLMGAYLGGRLVAAVELRFGTDAKGLRYLTSAHADVWNSIKKEQTLELNKLVVHPDLQGSDVVLGMFQKCHAIAMAQGGRWDAVFCATNKLLKLYLRAGAESLNYSIPHPTLENEELHFLVVRHETYLGQDHFNPYAWKVVYSVVHEAMAVWGAAPRTQTGWLRWLRFSVSKAASLFVRTRKSKSEGDRSAVESAGPAVFVDPRWTKQDMLASILLPYILEIEELHNRAFADDLLKRVGVPRNYFESKSAWVSVDLLNNLLEVYQSLGGNLARLNERAGWRSFSRPILGLNYHIIRLFLTPVQAFRTSFERIMPRINRSRTYRLVNVDSQSIKVAIGVRTKQDLPKFEETCLNWRSGFEAYIELLTGRRGRISKTACCFKGDPECMYEIQWDQHRKIVIDFSMAALRVAGPVFTGVLTFAITGGSVERAAFVAVAVLVGLGWYRNRVRLGSRSSELEALHKSSFEFQAEVNERYAELQVAKVKLDHRYREALLLEDTSKRLQQSTKLEDIFEVSLEDARKILNLSRAFVMLRNAEGTHLQTASISGVQEGTEDLWKFKVDVTKARDNPTVVSSVYRTGNPVIIDNVEAHLFQLNAESRALMAKLRTKGFVMVQIPGAVKPWGVILADRAGRAEALSRNDTTLLQRVAQFVGLALDKQEQIDTERKIKDRFRRFVPWDAVGDTSKDMQLGGETKQVACLFLDIRSFTSITQNLPPQAVIQMLNIFFSDIQKIVTTHGGTIDKFLGDGCLITWGAIHPVESMAIKSVQCALNLLKATASIQAKLQQRSFPGFEFGLGLAVGDAVAGNLGSQDRMEFTIIGPTVNLASRLESLTKVVQSNFVVSLEVLHSLPEELRNEFEESDGLDIRGFSGKQRVGVFRGNRLSLKAAA